MARMREAKGRLENLLLEDDWQSNLEEIAKGGLANTGALFSFLLRDHLMMHRAACALGLTIAAIAQNDPEKAKILVRNFMWHMNEDSGNIGWGIPDAFAETLAHSPMLANTYANILISYIIDLGHADNYCDNDILRRSCFWAVGRFAQAQPQLALKAIPWLVKGLSDRDNLCRGYAAWALGQLPPDERALAPLRQLALTNDNEICEVFEHMKMEERTVGDLAAETLKKYEARGRKE